MGKAASRKRLARSGKSGQFESASPLNDPALLDCAIRTYRALDYLEPIFRAFGESADANARAFAAMGYFLATFREAIRDELVVDKASLREATKPELRAAVLYPQLMDAAQLEARLSLAGIARKHATTDSHAKAEGRLE